MSNSREYRNHEDQINRSLKPDDFFILSTKQKISIKTRKLFDNKNDENSFEQNDDKYTHLLLMIISNKKFLEIVNESSRTWIKFFEENDKWLKQISSEKIFEKMTQYKISENLKKFILKFRYCIRADINNVKQILKRSGLRDLTDETSKEFSRKYGLPIFEAPVNHIIRIWKFNVIKYIFRHYPRIIKDIMNNKNTIYIENSRIIHNYLYKSRFTDEISQLYLNYFEKINATKDLKNMINYLKFTQVSFADIYDEDFDFDDYEDILIKHELGIKRPSPLDTSNPKKLNENETSSAKSVPAKIPLAIEKEKSEVVEEVRGNDQGIVGIDSAEKSENNTSLLIKKENLDSKPQNVPCVSVQNRVENSFIINQEKTNTDEKQDFFGLSENVKEISAVNIKKENIDETIEEIVGLPENPGNEKSLEVKKEIPEEIPDVEFEDPYHVIKRIKLEPELIDDLETTPQMTVPVKISVSETKIEKSDASVQTKAKYFLPAKIKQMDASIQVKPAISLKDITNVVKDSTEKYSCIYTNLYKLYTAGKHTDIELLTRDKKFYAHKCVLAAQSETLWEMIENDAKAIDMSKADPEAVESMLEFMYKNELDNVNKISIDLFKLAFEYNIKKLIDICKQNFLHNINIQNSSDIFILADKIKNKKLKKKVIKFILANRKKVVKTNNFKNMQLYHPQLVAELFCYDANIV